HPVRDLISFIIGDDLLDVDWRRQFVERKMTRIDSLHAFSRYEPQFAICGLCDGRAEVGRRNRVELDAVRRIPNRRFNPTLRVGDPRVQFASRDAHQTAGRVQPERTIVVLYGPVNRVARQTIPAGERSDAAVFDAAKAALLGSDPQRPIAIKSKAGDMTFTQPISGGVRRANLTILEISKSVTREHPDSPTIILKQRLRLIIRQSTCFAEDGALSILPPGQTLVSGYPNAPVRGCYHRKSPNAGQTLFHRPGSDGQLSKPVESTRGGDPDTAFTILEKALDDVA